MREFGLLTFLLQVRRCRRRCCWQDVPPHIIHYEQVPFRIRPDGLRQLCCYCYVSGLYFLSSYEAVYTLQAKDGSKNWNILSIFRRRSYKNPQTKGSCYSTAFSTHLFVHPTGSTKPAAGSTRGYRRTTLTLRAMNLPVAKNVATLPSFWPPAIALPFQPHSSLAA